ncbi:hypothetical protein M2454_002563 [Aequitasia blattaphilus]|uniref:MotA/TolQ/ExbB proton channel domain-containing protein n=1 Tax=Aequitasia blattaphilus TaxID=2949332 RepID=A0ABT1EC53_9FIRM|nr:hypothetical protein [Aequitasia blattaphilus]MCP1103224.1 hypothetical protein [Aequitasia blattaphilus]MCR8615864.1 hypothetical protein [Aequitasia blattaphilus]
MKPTRKQAMGFYLSILTIIIALAALIFYLINCNSSYFKNQGVHPLVAGGITAAIIVEIVYVILVEKLGSEKIFDILPVIVGICLMVAFGMFISVRVAGIASIMTFEKNAQTTADMNGAIIGMVLCVSAGILNMITSFFRIIKED